MITEEKVRLLVEQQIAGSSTFLVDVKISAEKHIDIQVDDDDGFTIQDCGKLSRYLVEKLDRDTEDFGLSVSSPGLSEPFKLGRQYTKNIGNSVKVKLLEGDSLEGKMTEVDEQGILLTWQTKERIEGRKAKHLVDHEQRIRFSEIAETKIVISFK